MSNVHPIMQEALAPMVPTRFDRQRQIEEALANFNPDPVEAQELLAALMAGLLSRHDNMDLSDIEHEAKQLHEALDELDRTLAAIPEIDECAAHRDQQAREEKYGE